MGDNGNGSLFETVIKELGAAKLAENARVFVEKPFGRDLASARELNQVARMSQETLAEIIATTRSRVRFFMNKFRMLGYIEYNGNWKFTTRC